MTRVALLFLLLLCACAAGEDAETAPAPITAVSVGRTPGKPMVFVKSGEPAEAIRAEVTKTGYALVVTRNVGQKPEDYQRVSVELTEAEWKAIVALVDDGGLRTWKPEVASGKVYDWGGARFEVTTAAGTQKRAWSKPLENGAGYTALAKHLGKLAKAKVKQPQLYYFGG